MRGQFIFAFFLDFFKTWYVKFPHKPVYMNDTCQSTLILAYAEYVPRDCALCRAYPYMPLKPQRQGSRMPPCRRLPGPHIREAHKREGELPSLKPLLYK